MVGAWQMRHEIQQHLETFRVGTRLFTLDVFHGHEKTSDPRKLAFSLMEI
jgi:hypothetical protein